MKRKCIILMILLVRSYALFSRQNADFFMFKCKYIMLKGKQLIMEERMLEHKLFE